ncbi:MAG: PLP-dependent aminotransferase family protein [Verrucomicrobia bacterium]|nr:PLP-dependent aminotransferase family protein [Verrucomicrobiota bacterium]
MLNQLREPSGQAAAPPLYEQVAGRIARLIDEGTLRPGERIPSVRKLCAQQTVSVATVTQAYRLLENLGLVEARPQSGYYVRARRWTLPPEPEKSQPASRASKVQVSDLVMEVIKATRDPNLVRMGASMPGADLFPTRELNRTMAAIARRLPALANSYDPAPGYLPLRVQVARRAMESGCSLSPDDIVTTCGATEALSLCLRAVSRPGDTIAIESPTFFGILQMVESLGLRACEIPTYPREGVCLDELADRLDDCRIKACLFTLNFSNPLGSVMPDEKKRQLVELLTERQIPLIEDDIYGALAFGPVRPKTAKAFDRDGWVLLCDSFTKTLAPGYRVGWTAPGRFKARVEHLKYVSTSATATLPQMAIADFLANGSFDHHLRKLRRQYAGRVQRVTEEVSRHFPAGTKVTRPSGGQVLWIELPAAVDSLELYRRALDEKISIAPGPIFSPRQKFKNFIRLNCSNPWTEQIERAFVALGGLVREMSC